MRKIRVRGPYGPIIAIFQPIIHFSGLTAPNLAKIQKKEELNNRLQRTSHKVRRPLNRDVHMAEALSTGHTSPVPGFF